jgi:phenylalanyl-tRNA synthetase beta chain
VGSALEALGVDASFEAAPAFGLVPGRTAEITSGGRTIGTIGQVHPSVLGEFDIEQEVYLFELLVDELLPSVPALRTYEPVSRYPAMVQDLALLVDRSVPAERVRALIEQHELVQRVRVFDVYEGERVAANKKSIAFSVTFQSPERTLTDDEVAKARRAIIQRLEREAGAELRGAGG